MLDTNKQAEINVRSAKEMSTEIHKPFGFPSLYWSKWAVISKMLQDLDVPAGADIMDLGCGAGWTSTFLAETGYTVTGLDIVPLNIETAQKRAKIKNLSAKFQIADMEKFSLKKKFDVILVFDALHHSNKQQLVINNMTKHLKPGGWIIFGEPSWLHVISPEARRAVREEGVIERGITARSIRRDCRKSGLGNFKRYFEGTHPYSSRFTGFGWQLIRLVASNFVFAPQSSIWVAAQKQK